MQIVMIVGNGKDKFTPEGEERAKIVIRQIIKTNIPCKLTSGHSKEGGIDIWSEEIAKEEGVYDESLIKAPTIESWFSSNDKKGYKQRNMEMAQICMVGYVVVADKYPNEYPDLKKFKMCYHCIKFRVGHAYDHVKSGACWTGKRAIDLGKKVEWVVIKNYD